MGAGNLSAVAAIRLARETLRRQEPSLGAPADLGVPLEVSFDNSDPPRVAGARVVEGAHLRDIAVHGGRVPGFHAFLDGTQRSDVFDYVRGMPLVLGSVAAVIRERRDRRMHTWQEVARERRIFAPRAVVTSSWEVWERSGLSPVDTSGGNSSLDHPMSAALRARELVQNRREALESMLAEKWCASQATPLFVDGGLRGSDKVATCELAVGVVKSHRTLYAAAPELPVIFALRAGHRSSVFAVETGTRAPVWSWYLRLREATGRDPFFGLVRVEVAVGSDATLRADEVSRWILAEVSPLSLPDARWHNLVYPIHDCEEYLRSVA